MSTNNLTHRKTLSDITTYQAGVLQASTHRALQRHCDEILKPYGITKTHWLIIGTINDSGNNGARVTDLASELGTTLSYLTNTINLLESKGILQRVAHKDDSRVKHVVVSRKFSKKFGEIEKHLRRELRRTIYSTVSPDDFEVYMKVLFLLSKVSK